VALGTCACHAPQKSADGQYCWRTRPLSWLEGHKSHKQIQRVDHNFENATWMAGLARGPHLVDGLKATSLIYQKQGVAHEGKERLDSVALPTTVGRAAFEAPPKLRTVCAPIKKGHSDCGWREGAAALWTPT
jgi:hypothetical protein